MYIVTDFIKGKTLSKLLEEEATTFSEGESAHLLHQLASAINHCHSKNITHRDVKLENIMVDERMNVTLLDFGLSKAFSKKKLLKSA